MKILYLGPHSTLVDFLASETLTRTEEPIGDFGDADFVISYGYRHILKNRSELARMDGRAVNLHISYLPWNRGADPNLWSWVEGTPKGVTIHCIDAGIDTGDILCQRLVQLDEEDTLATSYSKLQAAMQRLFIQHWPLLRDGRCQRSAQRGRGSFHLTRDKGAVAHLLTRSWDTTVSTLASAPKA